MSVVEYTPDQFETLRAGVSSLGPDCSLTHRSFVDYYYASGSTCKLLLAYSQAGLLQGTLGLDRMDFGSNRPDQTIYAFNNFYSLVTHGVAPILREIFRNDMTLLAFGGTIHTQQIMASFKHKLCCGGIKLYYLNRKYKARPEESFLRRVGKRALNRVSGKPLLRYFDSFPADLQKRFSVREEYEFTEDMLPKESPFQFRFIPTLDYLRWRYNLRLPFVRYRLFRILEDGGSAGYVIINESPSQVMIAQSDGLSPEAISYGGLLSILQVSKEDRLPRTALAAISHPAIQTSYEQFGFKPSSEERFFGLARRKTPIAPLPATDTWLVNFDWTDNGLRVPFADQHLAA